MRGIRTFLALAVAAGLIFLGLWALLAMIRFGSCASGGTYVSARQCAPGTGLKVVELMGSIFGTIVATSIAAMGGQRAVWAIMALIPGAVASYFYVIAFATTLGAGSEPTDKGPALIAGAVLTAVALPLAFGAVRPRRSAGPASDEILIDSPTGRVHVRITDAGGPAAIVRATRRRD